VKLLILTQWYPPEPAELLQELATTLQARGHSVTVLTGFPNYPTGRLYPGYKMALWRRETLAGVPMVRVPLFPSHNRSGLGRAANYLSFALASSVLGPLLLQRPDVMFVYHPPLTVGIPAWILSRFWHRPFVYQIQDMWPETLRATGMLRNEWILAWIGRFAQWVYGQADRVCVISPGFRENLLAKGVPGAKISVIPNWVDLEPFAVPAPDINQGRRLGLSGRFNVMFAGNMGEAQALETVIEAAALLQDLPLVQFVLVGDGIALPGLQQAVAARSLTNVRFLGRHPAQDMPGIYALADVLLVHLKDDPLFRITIPHKTLTYLATGKPILAAVAGDTARLVVSTGAGIDCPPGNPLELARAVRQLHGLSQADRQQMGKQGRTAASSGFGRDKLVGQIEALLLRVISASGSAQ